MEQLRDIPLSDTLSYLGFRGQAIDDVMRAQIDEAREQMRRSARPRLVMRAFDLVRGDGALYANGTSLCFEGHDIAVHLTGCRRVLLLAATLGQESEQCIARANIRDMARAVILDACASAGLEAFLDQQQTDWTRQYAAQGLFLTRRYSPGYGDFPLEVQPRLLTVLNATRAIGLYANESCLLIPRKSVTAIIGLSEVAPPVSRPNCDACALNASCLYRKRGTTCEPVS